MTPESVMTIGRTALGNDHPWSRLPFAGHPGCRPDRQRLSGGHQINDASLSFIPKVIAVLATFAIAGPWMLTVMTDYMRRVLTNLPGVIG